MTGAERYDYAFDPGGSAWAARILKKVPTGTAVLELGPGPGAMTRVLRSKQCQVVAIENDVDAIENLKTLGVEVLDSNLEQSNWGDELQGSKFDVLLACDVLEHLRNPEQVLEGLLKHCAADGKLIVSVPNIAYCGVLASLRNGQFNYSEKGQLDRTHLRFFTRDSFQELLLVCGWLPISFEPNRVPVEESEFAEEWRKSQPEWKALLSENWPDADVYQWMFVAIPYGGSGIIQLWKEEKNALEQFIAELQGSLSQLTATHDREHASLLEHQKAFSEAKAIISDLSGQVEKQKQEITASKLQEERILKNRIKRRLARWLGLTKN